MSALFWLRRLGVCALALVTLSGCDTQRMADLVVGVSTEAQVRQSLGEPERIWPEADGAHTLEYNRQPAGNSNYMITIGPDGTMRALQQVLAPRYFAKVQSGMGTEQVRRLLGKPARQMPYALKQQTEWEWNWADGARRMEFVVVFDAQGRVISSHSAEKLHDGP